MRLLIALTLGLFLSGPVLAQNVATVPPEGAQVGLTLSQEGLSLVSDRRTANLPAGKVLVRFTGVSAQLEPASVQPMVTGPGPAEVLEQHFRYDLADRTRLLRHYVGQQVTLIRESGAPVTGTLLGVDGVLLLETPNGLLVNPEGTFAVPRADGGIAAVPTLEWTLNVPTAGSYTLEARYRTSGLTWKAGYLASLNAAGDRLSLRGWVDVNNESGAEFRGAQVALLSGKPGQPVGNFTLGRAVDLPRRGARQLSYVSVPEMPVTQELVFFAQETQANFSAPTTAAPQLTLRLRNSTQAGLGVPLPAGPFSILGLAADGSLRQIAERPLPVVVPDQRITLSLRPGTGINAARSQVATRQLNPLTNEFTLQIVLTNTRAEEQTVTILERLPSNAKIAESTVPAAPVDADLVEFKVAVPARGTATLKYVVEVKK